MFLDHLHWTRSNFFRLYQFTCLTGDRRWDGRLRAFGLAIAFVIATKFSRIKWRLNGSRSTFLSVDSPMNSHFNLATFRLDPESDVWWNIELVALPIELLYEISMISRSIIVSWINATKKPLMCDISCHRLWPLLLVVDWKWLIVLNFPATFDE